MRGRLNLDSSFRERDGSYPDGETSYEIAQQLGVTFQAVLKRQERTIRALWMAGVVARRVGDDMTPLDWLAIRSLVPGQAGLIRCLAHQRWLAARNACPASDA